MGMRKYLFLSVVLLASAGFAASMDFNCNESGWWGITLSLSGYRFYRYSGDVAYQITYVGGEQYYPIYVVHEASNKTELLINLSKSIGYCNVSWARPQTEGSLSFGMSPGSVTWTQPYESGYYQAPSSLLANVTAIGGYLYNTLTLSASGPYCGDDLCEGNETCVWCSDCNCSQGYFCNTSSQLCQENLEPVCGNSIVESGEECDGSVGPCCGGCGTSNYVFCNSTCRCENITCVDTDGGINYYIKGTRYLSNVFPNQSQADYCYTSTVLYEYYCSGPVVGATSYTCPDGCSNGACVNATPSCGDGYCNVSTENCETCVSDCECSTGYDCSGGSCVLNQTNFCGDGFCNTSVESCATCTGDCACSSGYYCASGVCILNQTNASYCGDGACDSSIGETCSSCANDCACASSEVCNSGICVQQNGGETYNGYYHKCSQITLSQAGNVTARVIFNSINDSYARYFLVDLDCPEKQTTRYYTSSGCKYDQCLTGMCHLGTGYGSATYTKTFQNLAGGNHTICVWPSSIRGYDWNINLTLTPATQAPVQNQSYCGDNICNSTLGENCGTCWSDCACSSGYSCVQNTCVVIDQSEIYPVDSDVYNCTTSTGLVKPATGQGSANWFIWNGCSRYKIYNTTLGTAVKLRYYTDTCSGCVCYYPDFSVYGWAGSYWVLKKTFDNPNQKGYSGEVYYHPSSELIMIKADNCFYLNVFKTDILTATNMSSEEVGDVPVDYCGDGSCNGNENCTSCVADCGCREGYECISGVCSRMREEVAGDEVIQTDEQNMETDLEHKERIKQVSIERNTLTKEYSLNEVKLKLADLVLKIEEVQIKVDQLKLKTQTIANYYSSLNASAGTHWNFISNKLGEVYSSLNSVKRDISAVREVATVNDLVIFKNSLINVFGSFMTVIDYIIEGENLQ